MLRRLTALLLALACVFTLALPAHETADSGESCCGTPAAPCCCPRDCAPPPSAPTRAPLTAVAAVEQSAPAAKPAARHLFTRAFSLFASETVATSSVRAFPRNHVAPAASVALFQAHCSLLI